METLVEIWNQVWTWFGVEDNRDRSTAIAAVAAVLFTVLGGVWYLSKRAVKTVLPTKIPVAEVKAKPVSLEQKTTLTVPEFIAIRREMKADLEQELAQAHEDEKAELRARIAEMETQIADPEPALAEAQKTIAELTDRLSRMGNDVGGDRLADAQAAFARLDYSVADDIFAEVEERQRLEVEQAARAAFGRGEIAEAEIRWHDAAKHFARAARLDPSFETLNKAREFTWRAGDADQAFRWGEELIAIAKKDGDEENIAAALNEHALSLEALGKYEEAEGLYREALAIVENTVGTEHSNYATNLNNLASVVEAQGRYAEAEGLCRKALAIDEKTIGVEHPDYAIDLSNLALVVKAQGHYEEAEGLYREALAIGEKTVGKEHPYYAIRLSNLAEVLRVQGRYEEAEGLYREAMAIGEKTIGVEHPDYAICLNNLALLLGKGEDVEEALAMLNQALTIFQATLPKDHHYIAEVLRDIENLEKR